MEINTQLIFFTIIALVSIAIIGSISLTNNYALDQFTVNSRGEIE
ncbi:MAG: hypothetical protein ACREA5_06165 [Nitrosotalea sp.]